MSALVFLFFSFSFFLTISNSSLPYPFLFISPPPPFHLFLPSLSLFDFLPYFWSHSWLFSLDHQVFIYVDNCRLAAGVWAALMLCPICHTSCPVTPCITINLTPSLLLRPLTFTGMKCEPDFTWEVQFKIEICLFELIKISGLSWWFFFSPESAHFIQLKPSHHLLPTHVDPWYSRAHRNSLFSPHRKNQMPAFFIKPTGFKVRPQRVPSLPTASALCVKSQTSTLQLKKPARRRRRKRSDGILRWKATRSRMHPQLPSRSPAPLSRQTRRSARRRRKSESGRARMEKGMKGSASRLIWTHHVRRRIGVRVAYGA